VFERTLRSTALVLSPIDKDKMSFGTGALVSVDKRLLVTNFHVVEKRSQVLVFFPVFRNGEAINDPLHYRRNADRLGIPGKVIHTDARQDLAVIQLEKLPEGVRALPLARQAPRPGETIHAVGNSGLKDGTLWRYSKGEVRQVYRHKGKTVNEAGLELEIDVRVVESQIPTNKGDSGGPVVNDRAELVAITQSIAANEQLITLGIEVGVVRQMLTSVAGPDITPAPRGERIAQTTRQQDDLPTDEPPVRRPPTSTVKQPAPQRPLSVSPSYPKGFTPTGSPPCSGCRNGH
jgi:S1-C subfamily serine protease